MSSQRYVFDTNIFAAILRQEPTIRARLTLSNPQDELLLCPVVFYEVYRGLLYRDARKQLAFFLNYTRQLTWSDYTQADWRAASEHWARLRLAGYQIADNDLLIGTFTQQRQAILVTDNEKHFELLGVPVENWRR